ncbi:hypothetical protein FXO37_30057 [Capsicum annuum]|nr:hypothetical protein FXO37_30057 [Capsicum annuum]
MKKENQEISCDKQGEGQHQYQDSIKNFESLSMVDDDGEKIGNYHDSAKKENQEIYHDKRGGCQYQDSVNNFGSLSMVNESEKLGLKRHWREVEGRVYVPESWGHEGSLREWMDCSSFDTILAPKGIELARKALMSQGKRARSGSGSTSTSTSRMLEIRSR